MFYLLHDTFRNPLGCGFCLVRYPPHHSLNLPRIAYGNLFLGFGWLRLSIGDKFTYIIYKVYIHPLCIRLAQPSSVSQSS